jgi:hypothetical protein
MNNRTVGIVATVITVLCCACPGFGLCLAGVMGLAGVPFTTTIGDQTTTTPISTQMALGLLCVAVILILIPIAVAFFTFRNKPAAVVVTPVQPVPPQDFNGPIPPAS